MSPILTPTFKTLPLPTITPRRLIHLVSNLLTPSECTAVISSHTSFTPSNVTLTTVRDREVFSDPALSSLLWSRISHFFQDETVIDEDGETWNVSGLNEVFRLCRYVEGGKFSPHTDGRRLESLNEQSFMTLNIYLNAVPEEHYGTTRFLSSTQEILAKVQPTLGQGLLFRDDIWHDGEELLSGVKYLLRTDVMYVRERDFDFEGLYGVLDEEGKGRKALGIAEGLEDAGRGGEAVGWYKRAFGLWPALEK